MISFVNTLGLRRLVAAAVCSAVLIPALVGQATADEGTTTRIASLSGDWEESFPGGWSTWTLRLRTDGRYDVQQKLVRDLNGNPVKGLTMGAGIGVYKDGVLRFAWTAGDAVAGIQEWQLNAGLSYAKGKGIGTKGYVSTHAVSAVRLSAPRPSTPTPRTVPAPQPRPQPKVTPQGNSGLSMSSPATREPTDAERLQGIGIGPAISPPGQEIDLPPAGLP